MGVHLPPWVFESGTSTVFPYVKACLDIKFYKLEKGALLPTYHTAQRSTVRHHPSRYRVTDIRYK